MTRGGSGAWELKGRYEDVDYAELPSGGTGHAWTLGANWYLNDFSRVMFSRALADPPPQRQCCGQMKAPPTRLQLAF